jgi:hypothetical protein
VVAYCLALLAGRVGGAEGPEAAIGACLKGQGYEETPLRTLPGGALLVGAALDSNTMALVVDNKAARTFLELSLVKKLGYEVEPTTTELAIGTRREPVYRLKSASLRIGATDIGPLDVSLTKVEYFARAAGIGADMNVSGVLGADLLKRCRAIVDLGSGRLFLKPPPAEKVVADTTDAEKEPSLFGKLEDRLKSRDGKK